MYTGLVTTGTNPLIIGSVETFVPRVDLNGLPDTLVGGSASLAIKDPNGNTTTYTATYGTPPGEPASFGSVWYVTWTVVAPVGNWSRAWTWTDVNGIHQVSPPIPFVVESSP